MFVTQKPTCFLVRYLVFPYEYLIQLTSVIFLSNSQEGKWYQSMNFILLPFVLSPKGVSLQCPQRWHDVGESSHTWTQRAGGWTEHGRVLETVGKFRIIATISINNSLKCEAQCLSLHASPYLMVLNSLFVLIVYLRKLRPTEKKFSQGHITT